MVKGTLINCSDTVNEYINREDWRISANANTGFSHASLINNLAGKAIANWWLDEIYSPEESAAHRNGDYHIHDLDNLSGYCCGHDLQKLLQEGFNGVVSRVAAKPPKHFREALGQMANYLGILQGEWAGAQAFSSFDTLLAPYVFYDMIIEGETEVDIKKALINFVYNVNVPSRWGQSVFSNVTIDWTMPVSLKDLVPMRGDKPYFVDVFENSIKEKYEHDKKNRGMFGPGDSREIEFIDKIRERLNDYESDEETLMYSITYAIFQPEMDIINRCFYQVLNDGDRDGQPFTFPIPTVNITEDFDWDNPNCYYLFENAAKYGSSYFQNFIGSQYLRDENGKLTIKDPNAYRPTDLRSMCCRLSLNLKSIRKRGGGLFGSESQTGSIGVVTINMARLGYLCKGDIEGLKARLKELCDMASSTLEKKRKKVLELNEQGLYPYTRRYINTLDTFFSTIGVNGMNEMVRNFTNDEYDITDYRGQEMCKDLLDFINEQLLRYQEETGTLYNSEASPSEGTTYRFAREDIKRFPDIIQAGFPDAPYYTNSSQLPVDFSSDPFAVLDLQDELQKKYSGGCVEKGNYVLTDRGFILIEDLVNNFTPEDNVKVVSYNPATNTAEWDTITAYHKIDVSKKDKIRIKGKSKFDITTSDWHPFFVMNKDGKVEERRADALKYGDYLICNKTCMFDDKPRELTRELAYMLGYFMGDGSMSRIYDNRGGNNISKAYVRFHDSNVQNLERITQILKENNLAEVSVRHNDKRSDLLHEVGTTAKAVSDFLEKYGFECGNKTYTVHFSETLKSQLNRENAMALLSGLIDSDGHIDKHDDLEYSTASMQLAEDILWLCSMLGIKCSKAVKIDNRYKDSINYRIQISHRELYRFESGLMSNKKCNGIYKNKRHKCKRLEDYNTIFVTSVSKTEVEDNEFYDLTTEKNHNYLCGKNNLVFIHNTVVHLYMSERLSSPEAAKQLIKKVFENYRLPYISITPVFSICPKHGYIAGEHSFCPKCDKEIMAAHADELDFNT